jgi:hypothetical protein
VYSAVVALKNFFEQVGTEGIQNLGHLEELKEQAFYQL